ncbi:hypothetical protein GCM10029978_066210 [Actinoallomurus acanthiterrae]
MRQLLDNETTQRVDFFRLSRLLKAKELEVGKAADSVATFTREVEAIDARLKLLDKAGHARDRYVADTVRQILGSIAELRDARTAADDAVKLAANRVAEITDRLAALDDTVIARTAARTAGELEAARAARKPVADKSHQLHIDLEVIERDRATAARAATLWSGRPAALVAAELDQARTDLEQAAMNARIAAERERAAAEHLDAVRHGTAGLAGERLTDAGIAWELLHDGVELADHARALFEPLLEPFAGAICVDPDHESDAIAAVSGLPGTLLVSGSGPIPAGVLAGPAAPRAYSTGSRQKASSPTTLPRSVAGSPSSAGSTSPPSATARGKPPRQLSGTLRSQPGSKPTARPPARDKNIRHSLPSFSGRSGQS